MAFGTDGALYITTLGGEQNGKLMKIAPGL
jgi:hypothetical protein